MKIEEILSNEGISESEIKNFRDVYENNPENPEFAFAYAMALRRSSKKSDKEYALELFHALEYNPSYRNDVHYFMALTYFTLGDFKRSREICESLLRDNPDNEQVRSLHRAIASHHKKAEDMDNLIHNVGVGVGIGGALLAVVAGIFLTSRRK